MISSESSLAMDSMYVQTHSDIRNLFNSFEQCNEYIANMEELSLLEYFDITHSIPFDHELPLNAIIVDSDWIQIVLRYLIDIAKHDARAFIIRVDSLITLGFEPDLHKSKSPKWIQSLSKRHDTYQKKQLRFLKYYNLIENIDYLYVLEDDQTGIMNGYNITRLALYRLISEKYGPRFLECIVGRISRVLYFFDQYKKKLDTSYIESMQRTINGLNEDIIELNKKIQERKHELCIRDSYSRSSSSNNSYISSDAIMDTESPEYTDEISVIHKTIEKFINRVDGRISDVHVKLSTITTQINDLVGSISLSKDEIRQSICSRCSATSHMNPNPVFEHLQGIFREYDNFGNNNSIDIDLYRKGASSLNQPGNDINQNNSTEQQL